MDQKLNLKEHKLLIANRGEIAYRILRTAKRLGLATVSIYTATDSTSPHVLYADESVPLRPYDSDQTSNSRGYLDADEIVDIARSRNCTLVIPGYGFLSENEEFAQKVIDAGMTWLGPRPETIRSMGLKHEARRAAIQAGVPVVPGSDGLVHSVEDALNVAEKIGWPVMLKSTGGGGGMGIVVCHDEREMRKEFPKTRQRALTLFKNDGMFVEKFVEEGRHIEVQIFGNGLGYACHFGERECSVQRRRQKVIEETPSPFFLRHPEIREKMCTSAVNLCKNINYASAGTCEFIVDNKTGNFYFLEMNTRLQVEHTITEAVHPGLDLVELMIRQGIAQRDPMRGLNEDELALAMERTSAEGLHSIQCRLYCENPSMDFKPCPGILQEVHWPEHDWLRIDDWVSRGTQISPFYDPLVAKLIVTGKSREEAIDKTLKALRECRVLGPPNNVHYLRDIARSATFKAGNTLTTMLNSFEFTPRAFDVIKPGIATSVQDFPGRQRIFGIPQSGPMDHLALQAANILVGNNTDMEGLEITLSGPRLLFHVSAVVAVTGAQLKVTVAGKEMPMWARLVVGSGETLELGMISRTGYRAYLAVRGGFPEIPKFLGSKATSLGIGGYQCRNIGPGDQIALSNACDPATHEVFPLQIPESIIPKYSMDQEIYVIAGPHCDEGYLTPDGIKSFFDSPWKVSPSSNRMGVRLEGPTLQWSKRSGGSGGSHPSNILDNGYAAGAININGDTPVILTNEGPSMGGYACFASVASGDLWKVGQLRPGGTVRFKPISLSDSQRLSTHVSDFLGCISNFIPHGERAEIEMGHFEVKAEPAMSPVMAVIESHPETGRPKVVFRQAGDKYILIEYGEDEVDLAVRARIHLFEMKVNAANIMGVVSLAPCVRSTLCCLDPEIVDHHTLVEKLVGIENSLPASLHDVVFPGRLITLPITVDDRWSKDAVSRYMQSVRDKAAYLPSNIDYLAENNGLEGGAQEALDKLAGTDWITVGAGFYFDCPFMVPIDPRARLTGQKYNPSRTYTPRGAIGIAGPISAIYPIESPGGYQLFGRTMPPWSPWGKGVDFDDNTPWLLRFFDQIRFYRVSEAELEQLHRDFDAGTYKFKIEDKPFVVKDYLEFIDSIRDDVLTFREKQGTAIAKVSERETMLLRDWEESKQTKKENGGEPSGNDFGSMTLTSSMAAAVWKVRVNRGDKINSPDDVVLTLEAMKTEIDVPAGEEFVGKEVQSVLVREGQVLVPGDGLVSFV